MKHCEKRFCDEKWFKTSACDYKFMTISNAAQAVKTAIL